MAHKLPFEREIRNLSEQKYPLAIRLVDAITSEKKPCDFLAMNRGGGFVAIEAKCRRANTFSFREIPPHQRQTLSTVANTKHGQAFLALNLRTKRGPGNAWLVPWKEWLWFENHWSKKSVRRIELIEIFGRYQLVRITKGWKESEFVAPLV